MVFTNKKALVLGTLMAAVVLSAGQPSLSHASPCLASGDPTVVQGASVATFEFLGINPAVTCIEMACGPILLDSAWGHM